MGCIIFLHFAKSSICAQDEKLVNVTMSQRCTPLAISFDGCYGHVL